MSSQRWGNNDHGNKYVGGGGRHRDRSSDKGGGFNGHGGKRNNERNRSRDRSRERDRQYSRENSPRSRFRECSKSRSRSPPSFRGDRNRNISARLDYQDQRKREDSYHSDRNDNKSMSDRNQQYQQQQRQSNKWGNKKDGRSSSSSNFITSGGSGDGGGGNESWKEIPPSSTLILRALAPSVTDRMIMDALVSFSPLTTRVVYNKATGEHRGFAFVDFPSVEHAMQVVNAFAQQPLKLEHRPVCIGYTDNNRPSHNQVQQHQQPRMDWICHQCQINNFARRNSCFKCNTPRSEYAIEVPQYHHQHQQQHASTAAYAGYYQQGYGSEQQQMIDPSGIFYQTTEGSIQTQEEVEIPSRVLVVRMIPFEADESDLQIAFAEMDGVKDIRLIRDRVTNESRGFGFVEFMDIEKSTVALQACQSLQIQNVVVKVQYARDNRASTSGAIYAPQAAPVLNPMAAAALQQAQWSMVNGYNTAQQEQQQQSTTLDDLSALLETAAAEAAPHLEEPKKPWPLPFEVGGGSYVYASDCGLYYDSDSMFYYHPQSKQYYNSYTGVYYKCKNVSKGATAESFEIYEPPLPPDNKVADIKSSSTTEITSSTGTIGLTLKPQKKKSVVKPVISFGIKSSTPASGSAMKAKTVTKPVPIGITAVSATQNATINRKHAAEIAKWSQIQLEQKQNEEEQIKSKTPTTSTPPLESDTNDLPTEAPICLLCRRKFNSMEQLRKHEKLSKLHLENLAKAKKAKEATQQEEEQYRDKEKERRELQGEEQKDPNERSLKRYRVSSDPADAQSQLNPASSTVQTTTQTLESGIGGKMLKMMGWKKGKGLGKDGKGITAPVAAVGSSNAGETIGLGAKSLAATIDVSEVESYRDKIKQMARARYEMASKTEKEN